jgi:hypothetical protein
MTISLTTILRRVARMRNILILSLMLLLPATAFSEVYESSFIVDMPEVTRSDTHPQMLEWTREDRDMLSYGSLHIPQPVIILSDKNKYKGIQPNQTKLFVDRIQAMFTSRFGDLIEIVDTPRADTLVMNIGITELIMKKKRGILGYSPIGAVAHAATTNNKIEDMEKLAKKIQMKNANLEIEFVDASTGEIEFIRIFEISGKEDGREEESWAALRKELETIVDLFYTSYKAILTNAGLPE